MIFLLNVLGAIVMLRWLCAPFNEEQREHKQRIEELERQLENAHRPVLHITKRKVL